MKKPCWAAFVLIVMLLLPACGPAAASPAVTAAVQGAGKHPVTLRIFAAASLYGAFTQVSKQFEADHPEVTVELNFAGSQQLASQINEGAPADIFASADQRQMNSVIQSGEVAKGSDQIFARNQLVVVVPKANPGSIHTLKDLTRPGLRLVLAAKEVPVGQYSLNFLSKASQDPEYGSGYQDAVLKNVVSYENDVKSVLNKVSLGEADAGIVYESDLAGGQANVQGVPIPSTLNVPASYVIAATKGAANPELARSFIDYLLSEAGQSVLVHFGFAAVR